MRAFNMSVAVAVGHLRLRASRAETGVIRADLSRSSPLEAQGPRNGALLHKRAYISLLTC